MENQKNDETKEMVRRCKKYKKIMKVIRDILIIIPIVSIILMLSLGVIIMVTAEDTDEEMQSIESNVISDGEIQVTEKEEENILEGIKPFEVIRAVVKYIILIIITDALSKIFENTEKYETPFTEENIKHVNKIDICTTIIFIITRISLSAIIFIISITAISSVFKYGYKLQIESDETL